MTDGKIKLRYSERKKLEGAGNLGPLSFDQIPAVITSALAFKLLKQFSKYGTGSGYKSALSEDCMTHFGFYNFADHSGLQKFINDLGTDKFLDFCELIIEKGKQNYKYGTRYYPAWSSAEVDINEYFERHHFGYRVQSGEVYRLDSPALQDTIIKPALFAVKTEGWEQVEKNFHEALDFHKGSNDEIDNAISAAYSALESALKAAGYKGTKLKDLCNDFKKKENTTKSTSDVPELIFKLLQKVGSIRHTEGNSHGKGVTDDESKRENSTLIINWVGAFIVYLNSRQ